MIAIKNLKKSVWLFNTQLTRSASCHIVEVVSKTFNYEIYLHKIMT